LSHSHRRPTLLDVTYISPRFLSKGQVPRVPFTPALFKAGLPGGKTFGPQLTFCDPSPCGGAPLWNFPTPLLGLFKRGHRFLFLPKVAPFSPLFNPQTSFGKRSAKAFLPCGHFPLGGPPPFFGGTLYIFFDITPTKASTAWVCLKLFCTRPKNNDTSAKSAVPPSFREFKNPLRGV